MNLDMTILGPLIGAVLPFLLPFFPGLSKILKLVPQQLWTAMLKAVDPGVVITWSASADVRRIELETQRAKLLAKVSSGTSSAEDEAALDRVGAQLAAMPQNAGGLLDTLKANPLLIAAIAGGVIFFVTQGGGCKKQPANPQPGPPPAQTK